jgi:hypothetical protein
MTARPPWLTAKVDQRLALMAQMMGPSLDLTPDDFLLLTPLTEPKEGASPEEMVAWDHMCDNCSRVTPLLQTGHIQLKFHGKNVIITFGCCPDCAGVDG